MSLFKGTLSLVRLAVRRDRVKLPVWMLSIVGIITVGLPALNEVYGSPEGLITYANTTASSVVARLLGGPVDGPNIGSVLMVEYFLFSAVLIAFMSTLAIVRHTRQNEELGRSELIGSLVVGRHAPLTAALLVAVTANVIVAALITLVLRAHGLPGEGAMAMAAGIGGVGLSFAAIAAVLVQITENARSANAMAAIAIGVATLVRGIGDALGTVAPDGLSVSSMWISWLSPIGWGQQMHPFGNTQLWPVLLYIGFFVACGALAYRMTSWRDVGLGLRAAKPGPAHASARLQSSLGLAWRLQRDTMIGWIAGMAVLGALLGVTSVEFRELFTENEQFAQILEQIGGSGDDIIDLYFSSMLAFTGIVLAGYGLQALQRLRGEEASGRLEPVLAATIGRGKWVLSHIIWVAMGILLLVLVTGSSLGVSYVLAADVAWSEAARLLAAAFVQLPAVLALAAFAVAVFGLLPRLATAVTWTAFAFCLLVVQLGEVLKLPQWVVTISPFAHTPAAPAPTVALLPLAILTAAAIVLTIVGIGAFRRRDMTTSG